MASEEFHLTISHRSNPYSLAIHSDATCKDLAAQIFQLTSVPPSLQKLLYKGKKSVAEEATVAEAGIRDGTKITLLGNTAEAVESMHSVESEQRRREEIMKQRKARQPTKVRSTATSSSSYKFHQIQPLPHLPNPPTALALLTRLAEDPAIRHVMQTHRFTVGILTELAPHEHPNLLGLNVNAGQAIKLRLRTDAYDGFRTYKDVRRVLCHELTHNVWGDHDNNFKELNSQLNREVAEFELASKAGTHSLSDYGDVYQPMDGVGEDDDAHVYSGGTYTLGGSSGTPATAELTPEERRRRTLEATLSRLRKEEKEIEDKCGSNNTTNPPS